MAAPVFRMWEAAGTPPPITHVDGQWLVTRHADIKRILRDPATFPPSNALEAITPIGPRALRILARHRFRLPPTLANNAGPSHPALRTLVAAALGPARVAELRPWLEQLTADSAETVAQHLATGTTVDLMVEVANEVPLRALGQLIDLPRDEVAAVKRFSVAALELFWGRPGDDRQVELAEIVGRHHARLRAFVRDAPGFAAQLRGCIRDHELTEDEVVAVYFFLLVAGQETTAQFLGLLLRRLLTEPQLPAALQCGAAEPAAIVEEGLRLDSPIVTWRRVAARDITIAGQQIPAGTSLLLCLRHAGRDPAIVTAADAFAPGQPGSRRHLAFGAGAHRCVGAQLSRMEAEVVITAFAPVLARARLIEGPSFPDNLSFQLPDRLIIEGTNVP